MKAAHPFFPGRFYGVPDEACLALREEQANSGATFQRFFAKDCVSSGSTATDRDCVTVYLPKIQLSRDAFAHGVCFCIRKPRFLPPRRINHMPAANDDLLE